MRALIAVVALLSSPAFAEEVKLGCLTQRVWLRDGVPSVMIASFDEQKNTANFFAKELGGLMRGSQVNISANMITFEITTAAGEPGDVTITRGDGLLMLKVKSAPEMKILAECQRQVNRF